MQGPHLLGTNPAHLAAGSEEEIKALSLALDINSVYEELQKAADVLGSMQKKQPEARANGAKKNETEEAAELEKR